jgi:hypothetical protein
VLLPAAAACCCCCSFTGLLACSHAPRRCASTLMSAWSGALGLLVDAATLIEEASASLGRHYHRTQVSWAGLQQLSANSPDAARELLFYTLRCPMVQCERVVRAFNPGLRRAPMLAAPPTTPVHNNACPLLQLLGRDDVREAVLSTSSMLDLWRARAVCSDFKRWCSSALAVMPRPRLLTVSLDGDSTRPVDQLNLATLRWERCGDQLIHVPSLPCVNHDNATTATIDQYARERPWSRHYTHRPSLA